MNHERFKIFRKKLDNLTVSDHHGLNSPGLTCYLNSVLQVLFMTEAFREEIQRRPSNDSVTIDPHLKRLFDDLERGTARTHSIAATLGITDLYEQRDAAEYFENILRLTSQDVSKIFKGELLHKIRCLHCQKGNDSRSNFWILPLVVEESGHHAYSVEQGIEAFFKGEKVCEENVMFCNHCNEKREAEIDCEITQHPEILTLLLKRFRFDNKRKCYVKLHCKVDVPQTLEVKSCRYDLYALVNHFGNLTGGHYTAEIHSFETREWYHFNDDLVQMVKQPKTSFSSCTAYLLMYRKESTHCEKTDEGGNQESDAHSDVKAEGRHDQRQRQDGVPHHQLKDQYCNKEKNVKHLNGDFLSEDINDATVWKKLKNSSLELDKDQNQTLLQQRPLKDTLLHTDTDRDIYNQSINYNSKIRNSKVHVRCPNSRGTPSEDWRTLDEQNLNLHKLRLKEDDITWERPDYTVSQVRTQTSVISSRSTGNKVSPAGTKGVKNKKDAAAKRSTEGKSMKQRADAGVSVSVGNSPLKSGPVLSNGHSPPSPPYTRRSHSRGRTNEPTEYNVSASEHNKTNNKTQHPVSEHSSRLEVTRGRKTVNHNVKKEPWR
ncbi:ubiquitin carboxyl-terminal hydrolase 47-like isoform X2 [Anabas testudineus]|uniref:Peptidase C19 ubiquitin carboxyl-terminal hydrolase domain-containing protein n=2 Tax=Anabas testudineus TaxID=64144 RepID=A0A3Q1H1M8_ANATE|nr:ubiquitin carboxyl-terminal hydrolase 47-like isoform X2 [Anabas testudineus]XP_026209257.1 ubiquitin carboxyl-terminal hydrolase 47-like isoform X2 [Anabas testudineus]